MGHVGLEFASEIDPNDGDNVSLVANFSDVTHVWSNPHKLKKNGNPQVKHAAASEIMDPDISIYNVNEFKSNILLYEYQLNPKEIKLIPLSIQYRTAIIDGLLKVKIFLHANPKLPKRLFDLELSAVFKERNKLTLKQSKPHGIQTSDEIKFSHSGLEANDKYLFEFEFLMSESLEDINTPVEIIKLK